MATLTLTVGASADDARINDLSYNDTFIEMLIGGVGTTPNVNFGYGWRFTSVTLGATDTINSAYMSLMKSGAEWTTVTSRWTCVNEDNTATFSSGAPPGSRAIVATIVDESNNLSHAADTVYTFPVASGDKTSFGGAIANVLARGGWASGNALAVVDNSDQDASAYQSFARELYHTWDSATASSEPQLVIDYTASTAATLEQEGFRFRADDGNEAAASWLAAQDVNWSRPKNMNTRLRILTNATGDPAAQALKLQFRKQGQTDWMDVIKR